MVIQVWTLPTSRASNPPTGTTLLCSTEAGYGGASAGTAGARDINTTGQKGLAWVSGSAYSGGVCTLPAGAQVLVMAAQSGTSIVIAGTYTQTNAEFGTWATINPYFYGYSNTAIGSGSGSAFTIASTSSVAAASFTVNFYDVPWVVFW